MDPTTIMAIVSCAIVLAGWLVLPHDAAVKTRSVEAKERVAAPVPAA
jgi:hypothetical protein